ncbi:superoxide dismutase family protein [Actinokineospora spheciospongiae]|uniref:superoxide dismutase family protein n=1 Tax=Actinokineospora spheciospongiae TaxID=909613 RepID=UPI000D71BEA8|nr:superoxide dismutase family protein [Actinokineospora spheciospongiae]PWW62709.1 Cu-Zn family superoxide dismutase [Actinokineospora spheciospongiae]
MHVVGALFLLLLSPAAQFSPTGPLYTYDAAAVPAGASAIAVPIETGGPLDAVPVESGRRTVVLLRVRGLLPAHHYGAHVHTGNCGADPAAAGPHTQNRADPVQPSVDPAYANPENEVWLDFTTDVGGNAITSAEVDWSLSSRLANSVVLHAQHTHTEPGQAGTAGARLACLPLTRQ